MALKSETLSPPNGVVNVTDKRSGQEEDLEDGEIFDDEESELEANTQAAAKATVGKAAAQTEMKEPAVVSNNKKKKESKKTGSPPGLEKKEKRHSSNSSSTSTKPKRKRVRDDEDPESNRFNPKPNKSRRSRDLDKRDEEVDEHELLGMRGGNSPPLSKPNHHHDNHWDRFDSQDEDDDRDGIGRDRGRRMMREPFGSEGRMARRARISRGGGGIKRRGANGGRGGGRGEYSLCKFYMQGKCQRGNECPFSHNALPPRKMELCKFYMMDCCVKKDKCLYLHNDFPCKFYHMGMKCYAGKRCRFSHGKMTPQMKNALFKHLETAPKDMLGDFPRMHSGGRGDNGGMMIMMNDEDEMEDDEEMFNRGPPPRTPSPPSPREHSRHHHHRGEGGGSRGGEGKEGRSERHYSRMRERNSRGGPGGVGGRGDSYDRPPPRLHNRSDQEDNHTPMPSPPQDGIAERDHEPLEPETTRHHRRSPKREHKDSGSGGEDMADSLPRHLPKTQRDLFLRIQQQQRKAEVIQNNEEEETKEDDNYKEENWYSSDDESASVTAPLNTILQSLGQPGLKKPASKETPMPPPLPPPGSTTPQLPSSAPLPPVLLDIDVNAVSKLLSSVRETIQQASEIKREKINSAEEDGRTASASEEQSTPTQISSRPLEEKRIRDPRLRALAAASTADNSSSSADSSHSSVNIDMDLRGLGSGGGTSSSTGASTGVDVDLRHLPFKPAPHHQAATEIDASLNSHPPIDYRLIPFVGIKPDYSTIKPHAKYGSDPRLRRYHVPSQQDFVARDPRNRVLLAADPRRKSVLLNSTTVAAGRFDDHHQGIIASPPQQRGDCDLRYPPPSPNIDDPRRTLSGMLPHPQVMPPQVMPPQQVMPPMSMQAFGPPPPPHMVGPPPQLHTDIDLRVPTHSPYAGFK